MSQTIKAMIAEFAGKLEEAIRDDMAHRAEEALEPLKRVFAPKQTNHVKKPRKPSTEDTVASVCKHEGCPGKPVKRFGNHCAEHKLDHKKSEE
jgi:hypothetical protein